MIEELVDERIDELIDDPIDELMWGFRDEDVDVTVQEINFQLSILPKGKLWATSKKFSLI